MAIEIDDLKLNYVSISEARAMSGLRIVLGAFTIPGPWHEACKGVCHVKGLDYTPVRSSDEGAADAMIGMGGTQSELYDWTAQYSAPVMIWNDERPRALWNDQLMLAERLNPEPRLIPEDMHERMQMYGLANELFGEGGLVYSKRHLMVAGPLNDLPKDSPDREFWEYLGNKYGYTEQLAKSSAQHIQSIVEAVGAQLSAQHARGRKYLVGDRLSAVDIYWATTCGILAPMPEDRCPMWSDFRGPYGNVDPGIAQALTSALTDHRDFIYEEYLQLPIVF